MSRGAFSEVRVDRVRLIKPVKVGPTKRLVTLKDVRDLLLSLPPDIASREPWQRVARLYQSALNSSSRFKEVKAEADERAPIDVMRCNHEAICFRRRF